ncbi:Hydrogenase transcriptional regulatory protein hupR1 [Planctomycetes bacterium CA13]|uniref:Hydrogenase transcriptional regulatory protein hupR1 n=1 Tax=Novipirellula herctigrandis TaxID=2527986 RepID=A0A5C5YWM1_9BACT|nr:Hydrogenase transcriptional regulatory protein hupR1 [Planctomycetes bacterium CA13]
MPATTKHAILIVDDEPDVLFSLAALLRRDFQVYTAASGSEALEVMAEHPVHVIMTDQRMPAMTGVELMQRVCAEYPQAVRIVFTGYADTRAVVDAINSGDLYRYITKPWDPDDLVDLLRDAASQHDAMAAKVELLNELGSYFEDALRVTNDAAARDSEFLQEFQARTLKLRRQLELIGEAQ